MSDVPHTFIIAEVGCNHQGDLGSFKEMILRAKECGADAVKGQKRTPNEFLTPEQYDRPYNSPHSFGRTYGEHREFLELSKSDWEEMMQFADDVGIPLFASVFDISSAKFCRDLDMEMFKIGSGQLEFVELLEEVASYGRPVLLSSGMSTWDELDRAVDIFRGKVDLTVMHCTSAYPAKYEDMNLRLIPALAHRYKLPVGFSGHHTSVAIDAAAVALGAVAVERHFTLDRSAKGTDQALSLEPAGLEKVCKYIRATELALGTDEKRVFEAERPCREKFRSSLEK